MPAGDYVSSSDEEVVPHNPWKRLGLTALFAVVGGTALGVVATLGIEGKFSSSQNFLTAAAIEPVSKDEVKAFDQQGSATSATTGTCEVKVAMQEKKYLQPWCQDVEEKARFPACYPLGVPQWHPQDNVIVSMPDPGSCNVAVSPEWVVCGWSYRYVQLAAGQALSLEGIDGAKHVFLKMIQGTVLDTNENGVFKNGHWETYVVTPPNTERNLEVNRNVKEIKAGDQGATFALMTVDGNLLETAFTDMNLAPATTISGPFTENWKWTQFGTYFPVFKPTHFWNLAGILLHDHKGERLCYNQFWTSRQDSISDGGYHNHDNAFENNTFGELHMVMYAAAPNTGMIVQLPNTANTDTRSNPFPVPEDKEYFYNQRGNKYVQLTVPLPPGYVHGPLWSINDKTGKPTLDCHKAIRYPYHGLITGSIGADGQFSDPPRYTMWVVFEHPAQFVDVPTPMLQYADNAYLQNFVSWPSEPCGGPPHGLGA
jgi:hypothetical protein